MKSLRALLLAAAALLCISSAVASAFTEKDVEQSLQRLDRELKDRDIFKERRVRRLDSLKRVRERVARVDSVAWLNHTMEIARGYTSFDNDSALNYFTQGYDGALILRRNRRGMPQEAVADSMSQEFRMRRATYLSLSGFVNDAVSEYNDIDTTRMGRTLMADYHEAGRQMYSYISYFYYGYLTTFDYWNNKSVESQRKLIPLLDPNSDKYLLHLGEYYFNIREYTRSRQLLLELVHRIDVDSEYYAIAAHILASIARTRGDQNEYMYYLAQSAISDMRRATMEIMSLQELGGVLFESGNIDRAHQYVSVALTNALESHASVRMMSTTELLAMVEKDHGLQVKRWRTSMYAIFAILLMCLLALVVVLVVLRRQLTRVARMRQELQDANATKDIYISQFLSLSSIYMNKLKEFSKLVNRKISAGQVDELLKITKTGKFIDEQSAEFYTVFDDAFLHIYPDFVEKVNALLRPEEQIVLGEGEKLNSDLRILAFMRLGIDDTNRVAQILNFSVNTIYAYRNWLRNRAINRATFEADIMRLGAL